MFSDADDEYSVDYLRVLYETAEKNDAQIVISLFDQCGSTFQADTIYGFDPDVFQENSVYSHIEINNLFNSFNPRIPNKLFNVNFIREAGLRFSETRISNDSFLKSSLFPYDDIRKWNEVQARIEDNKPVSERESLFQKRRKNRINTAELLRQTSKELYDRDFESAINKHRIPLNANEKTGLAGYIYIRLFEDV